MSDMQIGSPFGATRSERLRFDVALDKTQADAHADDIRTIMGKAAPEGFIEGDILNLFYEVSLHYFGDVEARLAALNRILTTPDLVKKVSLEELTRGESLLVGIVQQIEALKAKLQ